MHLTRRAVCRLGHARPFARPGRTAPAFDRFTDRTPRLKLVVDLSAEEATALGHGYVGTEHLLLGILREGEGVAARTLRNLRVTAEQPRADVLRIVGEGPDDEQGCFTRGRSKVAVAAMPQSDSKDEPLDCRSQMTTRLAEDVPAAYPGGPSHKARALVFRETRELSVRIETNG